MWVSIFLPLFSGCFPAFEDMPPAAFDPPFGGNFMVLSTIFLVIILCPLVLFYMMMDFRTCLLSPLLDDVLCALRRQFRQSGSRRTGFVLCSDSPCCSFHGLLLLILFFKRLVITKMSHDFVLSCVRAFAPLSSVFWHSSPIVKGEWFRMVLGH